MRTVARWIVVTILLAVMNVGLVNRALAQATAVSVSGTTYTQNFDSMTNISSAALPGGWSIFRSGATAAAVPVTYTSGSNTTAVTVLYTSGTPTAGGAYLWAPTAYASGTEKSIGFLTASTSYPGPTNTSAGSQIAILFGFTNTTGATITNLDLNWNYERYREGTRNQSFQFYSSADGSTWTSDTLGDQAYTGVSTTTMYNPPQQIAKSLSIPSLNIANGSNYYFRWSWVTTGSWSNAQGVGLDDFTMNLTTSGSVANPDLYWDGGTGWTATAPGLGGNGSWADGSGSWDSSKKATFGGTAGTVSVATVTASNGLVFTTTGYTLSGGTITLAGVSSGINAITTGTDGTVTTTINSTLAGSAGMMKMGPGTLVLAGSNTFTGGLTLSAGTLRISSDGNLGDAAGAVSLNGTLQTTADVTLGSGRAVSGAATLDIAPGTALTSNGSFGLTSTTLSNSGTLDLQGATRSVGTLTFGTAATVNGAGAISMTGLNATAVTSGSAVVNPAITFSSGDKTVDVGSGGTLVLAGDISGMTNRIQKTGPGTLIVSGSNTTSGYRLGVAGVSPTNGGTLILTAAAASGTGQLQLNYGTLQTTAPFTFANGLSVGGRTGAVAVLGGPNAITFSGSSNFFRGTNTSGELRLDVNNATTIAGLVGATSGGGSATGITIGGTGQLTLSGNAAALLDALTLTDSVRLAIENSLGSSVTVGPNNAIGGGGTILGSLSFTSGADLLFDATKTLTVNGASVSFGDFGVANLLGFSSLVPDGTYQLISGLATINTANLANLGVTNAFDLGDGRRAYFDTTSGLSLLVIPEPGSVALAGLGLIVAVIAGRRRRFAA